MISVLRKKPRFIQFKESLEKENNRLFLRFNRYFNLEDNDHKIIDRLLKTPACKRLYKRTASKDLRHVVMTDISHHRIKNGIRVMDVREATPKEAAPREAAPREAALAPTPKEAVRKYSRRAKTHLNVSVKDFKFNHDLDLILSLNLSSDSLKEVLYKIVEKHNKK